MVNSEYQKPFSKIGVLNAEIITRSYYCVTPMIENDNKCHCGYCRDRRNEMKRKVNKLMGRKFYEDI